jgi:hypothetical protein
MPNFKPKNIKKMVVSKNITTLDGKHKELIDSFNADKLELLPALLEEKTVICQKIKNHNSNPDDINIDELLEMTDRLADIKNKIRLIKKKEKDYLLNNSSYIFDYFETKKKIVDCENKTTSLDNFFKINKNVDTAAHIEDLTNERKNIQSYMRNVDEKYLDITKFIVVTDICRLCNKGEMIAVDYEGIMICNVCSNSVKYLVENEKPSYKEPPKEVCFYAYKRINHFREILAQFQAKETTQIPDEVIENIIQQIKKERIDLSHMTNRRTKEILKKLGYNKYYEHIPFIKDKLGIKPPIMSSELENTLCNLFMDIQGPYAKYCPDDRVNFLNYYYTVYKLCELLNQLHFLPYFPMLKDREKRIEQDEIWKNICEELGWEYIPTI